jgi:hypothetical protein
MKWTVAGLLVGAIAVSLVGCAELVSPPVAADAERSALEQRALDLKASVIQKGGITAVQRRELRALAVDISAWQARTGRNDIAVSTSAPSYAEASLAVRGVAPSGPASCAPCAPVTASGGKICFLAGDEPCPPPSEGLTLRVCVYICITVDPDAAAIRQR